MAELFFDADADRAVAALNADPDRAALSAQVNKLLDRLEADPTVADLRTRRFTNGLWSRALVAGDDRWIVLWDSGTAADVLRDVRPDDISPETIAVLVHSVGPASFA
jgi:hypothetical protein